MHSSKKPVCLTFYMRPDNIRKILSKVSTYQPSRLYLVCDGPRMDRPGEETLCELARQAAQESVTWPCDVRTNYSDVNLGVKDRIASGIAWVFKQEESAIFLEDDTIPDPSFFPYCEALLDHYRDDQRIMMISGSNPLANRTHCPDSYLFSRYFQIWGFATWRRTWSLYDITMVAWPGFKAENALHSFYCQPSMQKWMTRLFDTTYSGYTVTWDVQLFFACLFNNGLSVVPSTNLVSNVGYEGAHSSKNDQSRNLGIPLVPIDWQNLAHPRYVRPSFEYDDLFVTENFLPKYAVPGFRERLLKRWISLLPPE